MDNRFEEILPWSQVPNLMKIYEDSGMEYYSAYLFIENVYRWHQSFAESDSFILTPNGKIDEYGTFMIVYPIHEVMVNLIFENKSPNPADVKPFLRRCIELISKKWSEILFGPILEKYWPLLGEVASAENLVQTAATPSRCYYMDKDEAKNLPLNCPENVYIAPVTEEHAGLINSLWPHRFEHSEEFLKTVIHRNGGVGIYLKENDELIAWGLRGLYNGPGNVQTVEKHWRKGFGTLVTVAISKFVAEKGLHPLFFVTDENLPAQNMYAKLSYTKSKRAQWSSWTKS